MKKITLILTFFLFTLSYNFMYANDEPIYEWFSIMNAIISNDKLDYNDSMFRALDYNNDWTKAYILFNDKTIKSYDLAIGYDLTTWTFNWDKANLYSNNPYWIKFNNIWSKFYSVNWRTLESYDVKSNFTLSWSVKSNERYLFNDNFYWFSFWDSWKKIFIIGINFIKEYNLAIPYDISTIKYTWNSIYLNRIYDIAFNANWTKLILWHVDNINVYSLENKRSLRGMVLKNSELNFSQYDSQPYIVSFSRNGHQMYIWGMSKKIHKFNTKININHKKWKYSNWDIFANYSNWSKSRLISLNDKTIYFIKTLSWNWNLLVDINGDWLTDIIYTKKFNYSYIDFKWSKHNKAWNAFSIFINNGDNTFNTAYKCVKDEMYYYGDCAK